MPLGSSVYKLIFDSNAMTALTPTRKELALTKQIMLETRPAAEQYGAQLDVLTRLYDKGTIEVQDYNRAHQALKAELPQNVAAQSALDAQLQASERIRRSLMTAEQEEAAARERADAAAMAAGQLKAAGLLTEEKYIANLQLIASTMPEVVAIERERLAVQQAQTQAAAQLSADIGSTVAKLEEEKATFGMSRAEIDLYKLSKRGASEADVAHIASLQQDVAALELERQAQQDAASAAEEAKQQKEASRQAIDDVIGRLTEESATFGMTAEAMDQYRLSQLGATEADQKAVAALHAEIAAKQQAAQASDKAAAEEQRLKAETDKLTADVQQLEQALREELSTMNMSANEAKLYRLAQRGASDETLATARALTAQHAAATKTGMGWQSAGQQALGAVPGVGNLASSVLTLNPAMIAGAAGAAALALQVRLVSSAAHALVDAVQDSWKEIGTLGKESRALSVGTQELIDMRDAAEDISGLDVGKFDSALEKLTKNTGEAAAGLKKPKEAFAELGLSAQEMVKLDPGEQVRRVADAFAKMDASPSEEARLAIRLLGQEGIALLPVLNQGAAAFEEAAQQSREFGNTVSDLDAEQVRRMGIAFGDFGDVTKGIVQDLAVNLAPEMTAVAEQLVEALKPGSQLGDAIRTSLELIPPILGYAADKTNQWIGVLQTAAAAAQEPAVLLVEGMALVDQAQAKLLGVKPDEWLQEFAVSYRRTISELSAEADERLAAGATGAIQRRAAALRNDLTLPNKSPVSIAADLEVSTASATDEADKFTIAMRDQIATFGMAAHEAKAFKIEQHAAQLAAENATGAYTDQISELAMMADEMRRLGSEHEALVAHEKARKDVLEATKKAQEELATVGMDDDAAQRYRLAQAGVSAELLKQLEIAQAAAKEKKAADDLTKHAAKEAAAEQKRHADELKKYREELEKQIATVGMTADQVKLYEMAKNGATEAELKQIAALQKEAAAHDALNRASAEGFAAISQGSREAFESLERARRANFLAGEIGEGMSASTATPTSGFAVISPDLIARTVMNPLLNAPIAPQPDGSKKVLDESLRVHKQIAKNTAAPAIIVEEVTY